MSSIRKETNIIIIIAVIIIIIIFTFEQNSLSPKYIEIKNFLAVIVTIENRN